MIRYEALVNIHCIVSLLLITHHFTGCVTSIIQPVEQCLSSPTSQQNNVTSPGPFSPNLPILMVYVMPSRSLGTRDHVEEGHLHQLKMFGSILWSLVASDTTRQYNDVRLFDWLDALSYSLGFPS